MRERIAAIVAVLRSPVLARIEFAFLTFNIGEWATWVAVIVYAYGRGGAAEAGIVSAIQLLPSIVITPIASVLGDRYPRARVLVGSYALQAVAMSATAVALLADVPLVVYVLSTITATTFTFTRPVHGSLLPEVVASPDELTAANVASGTIAGAGALLGPILAGALVNASGEAAVFVVAAAGAALGALATARLTAGRGGRPTPAGATTPTLTETPSAFGLDAVRDELAGGIRAVFGERRLAVVVGLLTVSMVMLGALDIFYAVLALEMLGLDEGGIGFLGAATGLGALIGSATAVILVGRERLALPLLASSAVFGGAVAVIAFVPGVSGVVVLLTIAGIASSVLAVAIQTMTQRLAGDDVMSRVFGVEEAAMMAAQSLGALIVPILLLVLTPEQALVVAGLSVVVATVLSAPVLLGADRLGVAYMRELQVLRAVPMLMPLAAPVLERLASDAGTVEVDPGETVIREGDVGDRFYVIEGGEVEVAVGGVVKRRLVGGDSFGEIALIHDVPRTATIRAVAPTRLLAIDRGPFLEAMTGQPRSRSIAVRVADERLAATPPGTTPSDTTPPGTRTGGATDG